MVRTDGVSGTSEVPLSCDLSDESDDLVLQLEHGNDVLLVPHLLAVRGVLVLKELELVVAEDDSHPAILAA